MCSGYLKGFIVKKFIYMIVCVFFLIACSKKPAERKMPPTHVDVMVVHTMNVPYSLDYPGTISGVDNFAVVPQVNGVIYKQLYKEGTMVKKNQPLYQIDPRPYENTLQEALGSLSKDTAAMQQYKLILDRYNKLYPVGGVSKQDVETATINYQAAKGLVQTDEATVKQAKLNIEYSTVLSPVDGLIGERQVTVGDNVTAQQTVLNYINSSNSLYASFSVPENDRLALQEGIAQKAISVPKDFQFNVNLELADGQVLKNAGKVQFFDTRISPENGSWNMRADVNNKSLSTSLLNGQFVHIYLDGAFFVNTISIPQAAVFRDNSGSFVYVVAAENKVIKKPVTPGRMIGEQWIIPSGLQSGDKVVVNGGVKLHGGETVVVDSTKNQSGNNIDNAA